MFKRSKDVPPEIAKANLSKWYSSLNDQNKVRLKRYIGDAETSSEISFLTSVMGSAIADENFSFAVVVGESASGMKMNDVQRFILTEHLIEGYIGVEMYEKAKASSLANLDLWPSVSSTFIGIDGKVPEKMNCRNRLIDVLIGVESDYDTALKMLDRFFEMGLVSKEDLEFRRQSLKVHRLQRTFDGVYTYRPKSERTD